MLKSLFIKDYALIETTEIQFGKGLNIITGETGAGKSILVDAMSLLLGERASSDVIRKGAEKSIVEGIFDVTNNKNIEIYCNQNEIDFGNELIVRREISLKGTNRCFINDSPVPLSQIKEIGDLLVDLHGQHEHQSLLKVETHIDFLDQVTDNSDLLNDYQIKYKVLLGKLKDYYELMHNEKLIKEKKDLYKFQINEIDEVNPQLDEEDKLEEELVLLENAEKLLNISNDIYNSLYENENSITDNLGFVKNKLSELFSIDKSIEDTVKDFENSFALLKDVSHTIRSYKDKINLDPERLNEVRERLGALALLKKKYGGTLKSLIEYREKIGNEFELAENFTHRISELGNEIETLRKELGEIANSIFSKRINSSRKIKKEVESVLKVLGIPDTKFEVKISHQIEDNNSNNFVIVDNKKYKCNEKGFDFVEFFISTNLGEDLKPLTKVASGGEISRIMLALKSVLAKTDKLPILIFDEIDTGISGRIAQKVGQVLYELAQNHQIIAITHLPQIAGFGDFHFSVEKTKINDRVVSSIKLLKENERVNEIAKLISGEDVTETSINNALELLKNKES